MKKQEDLLQKIRMAEIGWATEAYRQALCLRDEILRKPAGLSLFDEDLSEEKQCYHFGAFQGTQLIGTIQLKRLDERTMHLRQVAVAANWQGKGIGGQLLREAEKIALRQGAHILFVHARQTAIDFYRKMGYEITGPPFWEAGVLHCYGKKVLLKTPAVEP